MARSQTGTTKCRAGLRISGVCTNLPLGTGLFDFFSSLVLLAVSLFVLEFKQPVLRQGALRKPGIAIRFSAYYFKPCKPSP